MRKATMRSVLAASLLSITLTSFNSFAAPQSEVDQAADRVKKTMAITDTTQNAHDAFYLLDSTTAVGHQAAMRAEYIYLTTLYADLISARALGDVANFITTGLGTPDLVTKVAEQGATMVVLWSPAAIATASEVSNRFRRLGYIMPQMSPLIKETITFLEAYRTGFSAANGSLTIHYKDLMQASKNAALKIGKISGATALNYSVVVGTFFLSKDAISFTAAPRAEITQAIAEIEARMKVLREELPEVQLLDWLVSIPYEQFKKLTPQ